MVKNGENYGDISISILFKFKLTSGNQMGTSLDVSRLNDGVPIPTLWTIAIEKSTSEESFKIIYFIWCKLYFYQIHHLFNCYDLDFLKKLHVFIATCIKNKLN